MNALNTTSTYNAPSISSAAMLVDMSISQWSGIRRDKAASAKVADDNGAKRGMASVTKKLLGDCPELKAISDFVAMVRTGVHHEMTMPWSNSGVLRLLPTSKFFDHKKKVSEYQAKFTELVEEFLSAYEWARAEAKAALGSLFNDDEYPSASVLARKFKFVVDYLPVPEAGDWRVDIGNTARAELAEHYEQYYAEQTNKLVATLYQQTLDPLVRMSEKLADPADGKGNSRGIQTFRDSLVENVVAMIDRLETYNLTNDPTIRETRFKLQQIMDGITPDALREDTHLRHETKKKVDAVIASLPSLDNW